jgi:hypothetical protein
MEALDIGKIVGGGYAAGAAIQEDMASKDILKQAFAGATTEQMADPQKQQSIYQQAALMAGQRGQASLAYSFQKQSKELDSAAQTKQINDLKIKEAQMGYMGQLISGASSEEDLNNVANTNVTDPAGKMIVQGILRGPGTFEEKKKRLQDMSMTATEKIKQQHDALLLAKQLDSIEKFNQNQSRLTHNTNQSNALSQVKLLSDKGLPISPELLTAAGFSPETIKLMGGPTEGVKPGESTSKLPPERQYNVGNIRPGNIKYQGQTGVDEKGFATFKTAEDGLKALQQDIGTKLTRGFDTPQKFIERYAPPKSKGGDNPDAMTETYINNISKALGINPNDKIKDTPENRKILEDAIIKQEGVASPASTSAITLPLKASTAAAPKERAQNVLVSVGEAVNRFEGISALPATTTLGSFAGLTGKDSKGMLEGLKNTLARNWTTDDQRSFEILSSGLDTAMATAVGGGFASASQAGKVAQYAKQLPRIGDSPDLALESLALIKQELKTVIEKYDKNPFASSEQKQEMKKELEKLNKSIPFTIDQINAAKRAKTGDKAFGSATVKGQPSSTMLEADKILGIQ